jgi:hypothetical protein
MPRSKMLTKMGGLDVVGTEITDWAAGLCIPPSCRIGHSDISPNPFSAAGD